MKKIIVAMTIVFMFCCIAGARSLDKTPRRDSWQVYTINEDFTGEKEIFAGIIGKSDVTSLRVSPQIDDYKKDWLLKFLAPTSIERSKIEFKVDDHSIITFDYDLYSKKIMFGIVGNDQAYFPYINSPDWKGLEIKRQGKIMAADVNWRLQTLLNQIKQGRQLKIRYTELLGAERIVAFTLVGSKKAIYTVLPSEKAKDTGRDGTFVANDNGTVLDTKTGLIWASSSSEKMSWLAAKEYCKNYRGGGYDDWRMPTQKELAGIYVAARKNLRGHFITELIELSMSHCWASETRGSKYATFSYFGCGDRLGWSVLSGNNSICVLPVRSGN